MRDSIGEVGSPVRKGGEDVTWILLITHPSETSRGTWGLVELGGVALGTLLLTIGALLEAIETSSSDISPASSLEAFGIGVWAVVIIVIGTTRFLKGDSTSDTKQQSPYWLAAGVAFVLVTISTAIASSSNASDAAGVVSGIFGTIGFVFLLGTLGVAKGRQIVTTPLFSLIAAGVASLVLSDIAVIIELAVASRITQSETADRLLLTPPKLFSFIAFAFFALLMFRQRSLVDQSLDAPQWPSTSGANHYVADEEIQESDGSPQEAPNSTRPPVADEGSQTAQANYCSQCSNALVVEAKFCSACGSPTLLDG